jgi:hypothetical protein
MFAIMQLPDRKTDINGVTAMLQSFASAGGSALAIAASGW